MDYYHDLVTEKSWEELKNLVKITNFILIGGWAVYLYTKTLKSKDIDIIVDFDKLPILEKHYTLHKNDRLALKLHSLLQRGRTPKGRKDFIDIIALINGQVFEWEKLKTILKNHKLQKALFNFLEFLDEYYEVPELNLNRHDFAKLKKEFKANV